jgi:hypothetical protein
MSLLRMLTDAYQRLSAWVADASRGNLSLGGLLGLALLVYGFYQLKDGGRAAQRRRQEQQQAADAAARAAGAAAGAPPSSSARQAPTPQPSAPAASAAPAGPALGASNTPTGRAIASKLSGVKRVTISCPGVLLAESSPAQLQESASLRPETADVVKEMARVTDVYLIAQVEDDVGEALVTGMPLAPASCPGCPELGATPSTHLHGLLRGMGLRL